jgi:hypothetical protein
MEGIKPFLGFDRESDRNLCLYQAEGINMQFKTLIFLICSLTLIASSTMAESKRYTIKSGVVDYSISSSGTVKGTGHGKLLFKDYGNLEISSQSLETTMMGMTDTTRDLNKFENGTIYSVDFEEQVIVEINPEAMQQFQGQDMSQMGLDMLKAMGAEKSGTEKILGYSCDLWTAKGASFCLYQGVPLKTVIKTMGMTQTSIATSARFKVSLSDSDFALPDYPHKTLDQMMNDGMQEEMQGMSDEEKEQMQNAMEMMKEMFGNEN